ncbi:MAG TPA: sialidase family protein [Paraburkholderia sp.]|uniref:sialidase family protein n=1 Tax=Paraburkholderia sp. TaxID=1926495 RepID=UPI002ED0F35F
MLIANTLGRPLSRSLGAVLVVLGLHSIPCMSAWVEQGPGPILNGQTEGLSGNPVSGASIAIAPDLTHPGVVYIGTVNGGVWKTANINAATPSWVSLTDLKLPALSINSLALSPLDSRVIFAGTGSTSSDAFDGSPGFGVARSTNGGSSWKVLAQSTFAGRRINSIVPTTISTNGLGGQVVLAATLFDGGGVYRSTNGGAAFTRVSGGSGLPDAGVSSLVADPTNHMRFYAGVPQGFGGGTGAGVYRSLDGGATWSVAKTGLSALGTSERILLSVSRNTGVVYAMVINSSGTLSGVFRSTNAGGTWTSMGVPSPSILPGGQGIIHGAILADPNNGSVVYLSGDRQNLPNPNGCTNFSGNVFRGDASLASPWQNIVCDGAQGTSPHADSRAMAFDTNGNVIQANDGGVYLLSNPNSAARVWSSLNGNVRPTEFHSVAYDSVSQTLIGGAQDTGTPMQSKKGGLTWSDFLQGDGGVVAIDLSASHPGNSIRYTSFDFLGNFNRSTWNASNTLVGGPTRLALQIVSGPGAGRTLFQADPNIQFYNPYVLNAIDPSRMLIGTASIYESTNMGDSLANLGFTDHFVSSLAYGGRSKGQNNPGVFYVGLSGTAGPFILHRATSSSSVVPLNTYPGSGVRSLVMDPQDFRHVFVVDDQSRVWVSLNEGTAWTEITFNLHSRIEDVRTIELIRASTGESEFASPVLVVGGLGGVFRLQGANWVKLSTRLPHGLVSDLHYNATDNVLLAGLLGRGAWTLARPLNETDDEDESESDSESNATMKQVDNASSAALETTAVRAALTSQDEQVKSPPTVRPNSPKLTKPSE